MIIVFTKVTMVVFLTNVTNFLFLLLLNFVTIMVVFLNVIIDFIFTICTLFTKNTNIPTLTFAAIFTEVISVLWFV